MCVCVAARQIKNFVSRLFPQHILSFLRVLCNFLHAFCLHAPLSLPLSFSLSLFSFLLLASAAWLCAFFSAYAAAIVVVAAAVVGRRNGKLSNNVVHNLNRICCVACRRPRAVPPTSPDYPLHHHLSPHTHTHTHTHAAMRRKILMQEAQSAWLCLSLSLSLSSHFL